MINHNEPMICDAALYFLDGQYLFRYKKGKGTTSKYLRPQDVRSAFDGMDHDSGWMPLGVMRTGRSTEGDWFIYSATGKKVTINIQEKNGRSGEFTIMTPPTVLFQIGGETRIFALRGKFGVSERLYKAPFPNVHDDGRVCWGHNQIMETDPGHAEKIWQKFFETPFNQDLAVGKSMDCQKNVIDKLIELGSGPCRKYPLDDLVVTNTTVGSLVPRG